MWFFLFFRLGFNHIMKTFFVSQRKIEKEDDIGRWRSYIYFIESVLFLSHSVKKNSDRYVVFTMGM